MIPTVIITVLSLGLAVLGVLLKKQYAKNGRLNARIQTLERTNEIKTKQLEIAARPAADPATLIAKLRDSGL